MNNFIVLANDTDYIKISYNNIINDSNFKYISNQEISILNKVFRRLLASQRLSFLFCNHIKNIIFKFLLNNFKSENKSNTIYIVYQNNMFSLFFEFIEYIKKNNGSKFIFFFTNPINGRYLYHLNNIKKHYDLVYTFDQSDSDKYHIIQYDNVYSAILPSSNDIEESDVLFIGKDKDRLKLLLDIYDVLTSNNIKCDFHIVGVPKEIQQFRHGIKYNHWLSYQEIVNRINKTNCILEILQHGQSGSTLRLQEAVTYKKKLITNNSFTGIEKYFTSNQLLIFNSIDDLNIDFIKRQNISYYNEDVFSPKHLFVDIVNRLNI